MSKRAFTMVELMVSLTIFAMVFGLAATLYAYATRRTTDALAMNNLIGQVTYVDQYLERTIENANSCTTSGNGSTTSLVCTMPQTGNTKDDVGVFATYSPISCSSGNLHWGTGNSRWFYWSD